ncbi:serine/threonine-protein kinase ATR-like isoform X1 [Pieris napi]|uniref:serine/threonine-protein kinase ATR-like isoform X1 n=1 Tax=Pieris napi TaxID=78633 RepID=UPI001FB94DD9|nr:serine/threonine-protein kinase ATR-like isoform X1 [Pieris napi]
MYETIELSGGVRQAGSIVDILLSCMLRLPQKYRPQAVLDKLSDASKDLEEYQREAAHECGVGIAQMENEWAPLLALVRDTQHDLFRMCSLLLRAASSEDEERWREAVRQARLTYPHKFDTLSDEEIAEDAVQTIKMVQKTAQAALDAQGHNVLLPLINLSPALTRSVSESPTLASLLGLPPHLRVYYFEQNVEVFVDSARRPCVLCARLTNGSVRRWLIKAESPRADRAAFAVAHALRRLHPLRAQYVGSYVVRALTSDCSLMEFLEDHKRLDELASNNSALALREAMRKRSVTAQHFLDKQRRFTETVAAGTVLTALLGVGDRHPQNLLVSEEGALVHVDWACSPRHDMLAVEPTPVRLTRNMIALATPGLESLILEWSELIREYAPEMIATLRVVYRYLPNSQLFKLEMMEQLVRGQLVSHQLPLQHLKHQQRRCASLESVLADRFQDFPDKESYSVQEQLEMMQLVRGQRVSHQLPLQHLTHQQRRCASLESVLADLFQDFPDKESYSVQEQVSSLLRMSTEPRILALTRPTWQPNM